MPGPIPQDVKVGDIGTVYDVPVYDNDLSLANFDPSAANPMQLVFKMPGATGLCVRTPSAVQKTIAGVSVWCLRYTVVAADVAAWNSASVGGFHQAAGDVSIEAHLDFGANQKWTSGTVTKDMQGRTLRVVARLSA